MIARLALDQLRERISCRTAYVNGWRHHERTDILYQIVNEIPDVVVHRQATSRGQLIDHLS